MLTDLVRRSHDLLVNVLQRFRSNAEPSPVSIIQNGDRKDYQSDQNREKRQLRSMTTWDSKGYRFGRLTHRQATYYTVCELSQV
jgi:hypothetical protein